MFKVGVVASSLIMLLCLFSANVQAQARPAGHGYESSCPPCYGGVWAELGNYSPADHAVLFSAYAEQGFPIYKAGTFAVVPYGSFIAGLAPAHVDWNNRVGGSVGVKLTKRFRHGIVEGGVAYAAEDRFKSGQFKAGLTKYVSYWTGWGSYDRRLPGSSWGIAGNYTPVEPGNYILASYAQQGVVAAHVTKRTALVPFIETTFNRDTKGFDWNNRVIYGGGVKLARPTDVALLEVGIAYLRETRFNSSTTYNAVVLFAKVWTGWHR